MRELKARQAKSTQAVAANAEGIRLIRERRPRPGTGRFPPRAPDRQLVSVAAYNIGVALAHKGAINETADAFRNAIRLQPAFRR
jgi:hypothetical protein